MIRKIMIGGCLFVLCLNFMAFGMARNSTLEEDAGYALLDSLVVAFKELAEKRESVMEKTNQALGEMMILAKKAKAEGQIDTIFFKRFSRILLVLKLVITPEEKGSGGILWSLIVREINQFIEDVEGEEFDIEKAGSNVAIDKFSQAVSHEIINLRIYLDNKEKREKLIEQYQKQLAIGREDPLAGEKDRQLMSMKNMLTISVAISDHITDTGIPPKQAGIYDLKSEFYSALSPFYVKVVPIKDNWGNNFLVFSGKACNGVYNGITGCTEKDFLIVSYGQDGKKENWKYDTKNPEAGLYELKSIDDFNKDLIMWNGAWIRAPYAPKKK